MKLAYAEKHVLRSSGLTEKAEFKIKASAHAFKILSSGLYSDKIGAVLREIGCNAVDAHIAAGKAHVPIEVKLPNQLDEEFYIKDFGPGLSHDEVQNLYTTYFASTKQESNDMTGAFGLGSKSPFSYTDSFSITSRHGGQSRVYAACIDNNGAPSVSLMGEPEPCGADTGVTISFPVKPSDYLSFSQKAQAIYRFFTIPPDIKGGASIMPITFREDRGTYAFMRSDVATRYRINATAENCFVVMGGVAYPLDMAQINAITRSPHNRIFNSLSDLLIRVPIGEVTITAARERLEYTEDTQKYLAARLWEVVKDLVKRRVEDFQDATKSGLWKDYVGYSKRTQELEWNITLDRSMLEECGVPTDLAKSIIQMNGFTKFPDIVHPTVAYKVLEENQHRTVGDGALVSIRERLPNETCQIEDDLTIVYGLDHRRMMRVRKALADGTITGRIILVYPRGDLAAGTEVTDAHINEVVEKLDETFKGIPRVALSTLEPPPLPPKSKRRKGQIDALPDEYEKSSKVYMRLIKKGSWGRVKKTRVCPSGQVFGEDDWTRLERSLSALRTYGMAIPQIVELTYAEIQRYKIAERSDWRAVIPAIKTALEAKENQQKIVDRFTAVKQRLDLGWREDQCGFFQNFTCLYNATQKRPPLHLELRKALDKHGLWDEIREAVEADAKLGDLTVMQNEYANMAEAFRRAAQAVGSDDIKIPTTIKQAIALDQKYPQTSDVKLRVWWELLAHSKLFSDFFDLLMEKDKNALQLP